MALRGIEGKVAVVTGGGSGIGEGAARRLSQNGAKLVVVDWHEDAAHAVAESLAGPAVAVRADVSKEEDVAEYMQAALDEFGQVDLIHLNAGIAGSFAPFAELSAEDFDQVIAVNLRSVFLGLRDGLRQLAKQGTGGAIVTTSSLAGLMGGDALAPYIAAKHGVVGLTKAAAVAGAPLGVRVNTIAPGVIVTGLMKNLEEHLGTSDEARSQLVANIPLGRFGSKEEAGDLVAYLLSDEASYVSGAVITIDGAVAANNPLTPPRRAAEA
jgi:NAD(P)-dependent dehydrogenase (short-subunit alcohol dehydrogenase family)